MTVQSRTSQAGVLRSALVDVLLAHRELDLDPDKRVWEIAHVADGQPPLV
jgi:hypothetical protein